MALPPSLCTLRSALRTELIERILPYWLQHTPDLDRGGFVGVIDSCGRPQPKAQKAAVLTARILWTFSAAARHLDSERCRTMADRAYSYLLDRFWDPEHGGVYWMLDYEGRPTEPKKQVYAQAFVLYGLTEYQRATGHAESLEQAQVLFELLERTAHDPTYGGYIEGFCRDWGPLDDVSLGEDDPNTRKSMNTTLHVLEAYTNLHRVWPDERVKERIDELVALFLHRIVDRDTYHLRCFFDEAWTCQSQLVSFGHDIEASWLLTEAVEENGNASLRADLESLLVPLIDAVLREGVGPDHALLYEAEGETIVDADRHWWPQAEALVAFVNAYEWTGQERFLDAATGTWSFIEDRILDRTHGEWHFRVSEAGEPYMSDNKVGPWKGPYHNARACLEILSRTGGTEALEDESSVLADVPQH